MKTPKFRIKGDVLYENGRKICDRFYTSRQAVSPEEHRAHHLAFIAFHYGVEGLDEVFAIDRTGLPDDAVVTLRSQCNAEVDVELTPHLCKQLELLGDEWETHGAKKEPEFYSALETLWYRGDVLRATRATSPQIWWRRA